MIENKRWSTMTRMLNFSITWISWRSFIRRYSRRWTWNVIKMMSTFSTRRRWLRCLGSRLLKSTETTITYLWVTHSYWRILMKIRMACENWKVSGCSRWIWMESELDQNWIGIRPKKNSINITSCRIWSNSELRENDTS